MFFQSQIGPVLFSLLQPAFQQALDHIQTESIQEVLLKTIKPTIHNLRNNAKNKKLLQQKIHQQILGPILWAIFVDAKVQNPETLSDAMLSEPFTEHFFTPFKIITLEASLPIHLLAGAMFSMGKGLKKAQEEAQQIPFTPHQLQQIEARCEDTVQRTLRSLQYIAHKDPKTFKSLQWVQDLSERIALFGPKQAQSVSDLPLFSLYANSVQKLFVYMAQQNASYEPQFLTLSIQLGLCKNALTEDLATRLYIQRNAGLPNGSSLAQDTLNFFIPYAKLLQSSLDIKDTFFFLLQKRTGPMASQAPIFLHLLERASLIDLSTVQELVAKESGSIIQELFPQGKSIHHGANDWLYYLFKNGLDPLWIGPQGQTLLSSLNECAKQYIQRKQLSSAYISQALGKSSSDDYFLDLFSKSTQLILEAGTPLDFVLPQIPIAHHFVLPQMRQMALQMEEKKQLQSILPTDGVYKRRKTL